MKIFVGNLSWDVTDSVLKEAFSKYGEVSEGGVVKDRENPDKSRGFGFVTMSNDSEARAAIDGLNGTDLMGRALTVNEARPKEEGAGARRGGGFRR